MHLWRQTRALRLCGCTFTSEYSNSIPCFFGWSISCFVRFRWSDVSHISQILSQILWLCSGICLKHSEQSTTFILLEYFCVALTVCFKPLLRWILNLVSSCICLADSLKLSSRISPYLFCINCTPYICKPSSQTDCLVWWPESSDMLSMCGVFSPLLSS